MNRIPSLKPLSLAACAAAACAIVPSTAAAADCSTTNWYSMYQSQPFQQFGDNANYWVMIGGGFEKQAYWGQWRFDGARVVAGNEPFDIYPGTQSLALSDGATATTPVVCINPRNPSFRFAMRGSSKNAQLATSVNFTTVLGKRVTVPARLNVIEQTGSWIVADSQPLATVIPANVLQFGTTASITFKASAPNGGQVNVDSVMVDPYRRG